jgi:hypothetical protein
MLQILISSSMIEWGEGLEVLSGGLNHSGSVV